MSAVKPLPLLLITPIFILLAHYLAVFPHEYAHATMAWILGFKNNPFNIIYGGKSVGNIFLLSHVDENVNYKMIYDAGYRDYISMIAFSGPGIGNGLLFIVSLVLLKNTVVKKHSYFYYFLFWFNLMNLGNFYDYVPIRTFASSGDVFNFVFGINISPWWVFIFLGFLLFFFFFFFFFFFIITFLFYLDFLVDFCMSCYSLILCKKHRPNIYYPLFPWWQFQEFFVLIGQREAGLRMRFKTNENIVLKIF